MEECPSRCLIASMCAPASIMRPAAVWRSPWNVSPSRPARLTAGSNTRVRNVERRSGPPSGATNTNASAAGRPRCARCSASMATTNAGTLKVLRNARVFGGANATRPPTSAHVSATSSVGAGSRSGRRAALRFRTTAARARRPDRPSVSDRHLAREEFELLGGQEPPSVLVVGRETHTTAGTSRYDFGGDRCAPTRRSSSGTTSAW
jgi:hypothetical protein